MRSRVESIFLWVLFFGLSLIFLSTSSMAEMPAHIKIGTAAVGGSYYPLGTAIVKIINTHIKGTNATAEVTAGSGENIRLLDRKSIQFGIVSSSIAYEAMNALEKWEKKYDLRACLMIAPTIDVFITLKKSGIKTFSDFKGKKVALGPAGAGWDSHVKRFLEFYNLKLEDLTARYIGQSAAVEALKDGVIDVAFVGGSLPSAAIMEATLTHEIHFIPMEDEKIDRLIEKYPFYSRFTIPAGVYKGLDQDFKWVSVSNSYLACRPDADEAMVYEIVKTVYTNRQMIGEVHAAGKDAMPKDAMATIMTIPFHPGAIKFFKEAGIWKGN